MTRRALLAVAVAVAVAAPMPQARVAAAPDVDDGDSSLAIRAATQMLQDPDRPKTARFVAAEAGLEITPPAGWVRSPGTALNPQSDPPEPVEEVARFQLRVADAARYTTPVPITSGLVEDATAVISIGVAREGSDLLSIDRTVRGTRELGSVPGFTMLEDEASYDGLHVLTRYLFSRASDRVLVVRVATAETSWTDFSAQLRSAIATFSGDPRGVNAPAPTPTPTLTPSAPFVAVESAPDPTVMVRAAILQRAGTLIGLRYVWGGNSTVNGMDCSAYVSWVWSVSRYTTESIWNVSFPIAKSDLRSGDALNLMIGKDPARKGHIRLFEAWANEAHTAMWVYEETPPRVVHRVVAYDDRYQPIRLAGLSSAGDARVIPGTPQPSARPTPVPTRRPAATPTRTPTRTRTPTPRPSGSVRPSATTAPVASGATAPTPTSTPGSTPFPSPTPPR